MNQNTAQLKEPSKIISGVEVDPFKAYKKYISDLRAALDRIDEKELIQLVTLVRQAQETQRTVFIVGNGGSASTASHWATDLGKGLHHRKDKGVKALSLSDNIAWISAAANDISYDSVFSDQLRAHGTEGDLLIAISASGNSPNIIQAIEQAKSMGIISLSIVGFDGGKAKETSDFSVHIPTNHGKYGLAEDVQLILNHFLWDYLAGEIK